jgi:hypothetical protein
MEITPIEQNTSPIIPQNNINEIELYNKIKEEIKGEIEICVPAKVLSSSGNYAIVQPLPNIKTNANTFIRRNKIKVRVIGSVSSGDVGYLVSGDVPTTNASGNTFSTLPYDPSDGEFHKFSNGFFISINGGGSGDRFQVYEKNNDLYFDCYLDYQHYHNNREMPTSIFLPIRSFATCSIKQNVLPVLENSKIFDPKKHNVHIYFAFGYDTTGNLDPEYNNYPPECYCKASDPYCIVALGYDFGIPNYREYDMNYFKDSDHYIGGEKTPSSNLKPYHIAIHALTLVFKDYDFSDASLSGLEKIIIYNFSNKMPYSFGYFGQNSIFSWINLKDPWGNSRNSL